MYLNNQWYVQYVKSQCLKDIQETWKLVNDGYRMGSRSSMNMDAKGVACKVGFIIKQWEGRPKRVDISV